MKRIKKVLFKVLKALVCHYGEKNGEEIFVELMECIKL